MHPKANVLLARQPIFNRKLVTIGYELLYRPIPSDDEGWQQHSGDLATNEVLVAAFDEIGIEFVTSGQPAYINFTENWLCNPPPFNPSSVVIEILEHIPATPKNVSAVAALRKKGFLIALDDYLGSPGQDPFLEHVDIIKLDILALDDISQALDIIESKGRDNFIWLAEKVETQIEYEACLKAGCNYFQGYFFSRPANIYGKKLSTNKRLILELISALQDSDITPKRLENLLSQDPSLTFRLLKLVNSASFKQQSNVESLQRAIMVTGIEHIKTWVTMLSLGKLEDKPQELCKQSLQRAFFCQSLASSFPEVAHDIAFTTGLLSNIDAYFDMPLEQLLSKVNLHKDIDTALIKKSGKLGFILTTVLFMEKGEWQKIRWRLWQENGLDPGQIEGLYLQSLKEAEELLNSSLH
jgi:EAL and modified HD-GYP domain-containing signal transduction protein